MVFADAIDSQQQSVCVVYKGTTLSQDSEQQAAFSQKNPPNYLPGKALLFFSFIYEGPVVQRVFTHHVVAGKE
jgi:hypothetical protein